MLKQLACTALVLSAAALPAFAQQKVEKVDFLLNWVPGGDYAPLYYAKKMGWYQQAGIDLQIEAGRGSAPAIQRVGAGTNPLGIADFGTALALRAKGVDVVGVYNIFANSAHGLYWLKSSGIRTVKDLAGKKIGNPPGDAARIMWPALAKANGIEPNSVTWVNVDANGKLAALKAKAVDATTQFYNIHHIFERELGADMGFLAWRDAGFNQYSNSVLVNGDYLKNNRGIVDRVVKVTQRAYAACVVTPRPCVDALVEANSALKHDNEMTNWSLVEVLMRDKFAETVALGYMDPQRMERDYELVKTYIGIDKPFDIRTAYTNEFLDRSIKMAKK
jgi:NitT/TauT family transport system substrate-binding protein